MLFVYICLYHCWCSLSTVRCVVEKSLPATNETVLAAHINLSVGSACHNALCSTNDATITHIATVRRLHTLCFVETVVDAMQVYHKKYINDDGARYLALLYIKI